MPDDPISRRGFLSRSLGLAAGAAIIGPAVDQALSDQPKAAGGPIMAYVGTYSSSLGETALQGNGQGIHQYRMDPATGALTAGDIVPLGSSPSSLAFNPTRTHLYAANAAPTKKSEAGSVTAFAVDRATGRLTQLNTVSSVGPGPAHVSVHPSGKYVLVANYAGGSVTVLPIRPGGELGEATDVQRTQGKLGALRAVSGPSGSFAISGHEAPHAHMVEADASGRFVISTDLALDQILIWTLDLATGRLAPHGAPVALPSGDGPRHFAFHPNGRWFYSIQEESSTVARFDYDPETGQLTLRQALSALPAGFAGTSFGSEIAVSPDGRFVYAANRLHDTIATFSVGEGGALTLLGEEWTRGDYPRHFAIDPTGNFLFTCNQRSDSLASFRIDHRTGGLGFTGQYTPVGTPSIIVFLELA